jgi:hypothetical protein
MITTSQKVVSWTLTAFTILGLLALLVIATMVMNQKGITGVMLVCDAIAGGLALWAAYIGTKQSPNIRAILIGAIFFFICGRIAQFMLI